MLANLPAKLRHLPEERAAAQRRRGTNGKAATFFAGEETASVCYLPVGVDSLSQTIPPRGGGGGLYLRGTSLPPTAHKGWPAAAQEGHKTVGQTAKEMGFREKTSTLCIV